MLAGNDGTHYNTCVHRWGICERRGAMQYDFSAYMELFKKAKRQGMKVQAVMSFHQGGGNVGDGNCYIPLPPWVQQVCWNDGTSSCSLSSIRHQT
jgi:hypothetical protein